MVYGIGVDIQGISQIDEIYERQQDRFLKKVFTEQEIHYCSKFRNSGQHYTARWAIKEAFYKALGTGISNGYKLSDVETVNLPTGQPYIVLKGMALDTCQRLALQAFVSISHSDAYAVGMVVLSYKS